jgi:molybdopterin synthase sulfur carrier subunit/molybdopterin-guanine dinucleotide biosynthesis protein A
MASVTVLWFAHLRDQRGLDEERVDTAATTLRELYRELAERHRLTLSERSLVAARNEVLASWESLLAPGDVITFLPPVSGG